MEAAVSLNSLSDLTFASWTASLPACPDCGRSMLDGLGEAALREAWRSRRDMKPELAAVVESLDYRCDKCATANQERESAAERSDRVEAHVDRHYLLGYLPQDAREQVFARSTDPYEDLNPEAWDKLKLWTIAEKNLWMMGRTGLGKTFGSRCVMNRELRELRSVAETSALELCQLPFAKDKDARLRPLINADIFCVQDIDKGQWRADAMDLLWHIIDRRSRKGRIIITSNLSPEEIRRAWASTLKNDTLLETLFRRFLPMERLEFTGDYRKVG